MHNVLIFFMVVFPFFIFPIGELHYTIGRTLFLLYMVLNLVGFFLWQRWKNRHSVVQEKFFVAEWLMIFYAGLIIVSTVFSVDLFTSLVGTAHRFEGVFVLLSYLFLFFLSFRYIDRRHYSKILLVVVVASVLSSVFGILQHYEWDSFLKYRDASTIRPFSFYGNANFFGSYLVLLLLVSTYFYLQAKKKWAMYGSLMVASLLFINLVYSDTRSAFIGIFIGLLCLGFLIYKFYPQVKRRMISLILCLLAIFMIINASEDFHYTQRYFTIFEGAKAIAMDTEEANHAGAGRWIIWKHTLALIPDYFWIGSGPDTLIHIYPHEEYQKIRNIPDVHVDKAHNEYLQIAVTTGVPSLVIYLLFLLAIVGRSARTVFSRSEESIENPLLFYVLLAAVIGYLAQAFFNISVIMVAPYFWILLGMLYRLAVHSSRHRSIMGMRALPFVKIAGQR